jgi:UDP-N-acetylmuramate dehydrogenase
MLIEKIKKFSSETNIKFDFNYDLRRSNWFNIGGKTEVYFKPETLSNLVIFLKMFVSK